MNVDTTIYGAVKVTKHYKWGTTTMIGDETADIPAYLVAHAEGQIMAGRKTHEEAWTEAHRAVIMAQIKQSSLRSAR